MTDNKRDLFANGFSTADFAHPTAIIPLYPDDIVKIANAILREALESATTVSVNMLGDCPIEIDVVEVDTSHTGKLVAVKKVGE